MTKNNYYLLFAFIIVGFILRMVYETLGVELAHTETWYYLTLLSIISTYYGLYAPRHNSTEPFDFVMDFKDGAQGGAIFAFGTGVFTYIFYKFINPFYLENFVGQRRLEILENMEASNASPEVIEKGLANFDAMTEMIYVPFNWSVVTVTALTVLAIVYGVIFAGITKYFPKFVNQ